MRNLKKILVPTELRPASGEAIAAAASLARDRDVSLTLLHVHDPYPYAAGAVDLSRSPEQREQLRRQLEARLAEACERAREAGVTRVERMLVDGTLPAKILEVAAAGQFDLIVLVTAGRTRLEQHRLASVASSVVLRATCPVLTLRAGTG